MQKCLNSDVVVGYERYHIQTEDWGFEQKCLVSHIFKSGVLIKKIKTSYSEVLPAKAMRHESFVQLAMQWQHEAILKLLHQTKVEPESCVDIYK